MSEDLPPAAPRDPADPSEVVPGGPVFQRLEEDSGPPPSPLRKHAVPLLGFGVLIVLAIVTSLDWRSWFEEPLVPPVFALDRAEFRGLDDKRVEADIYIDVTNPNSFGAQVLNYTVSLTVDGLQLANQRVERVVDFPGGESGELLIPVEVAWSDLAERIDHHAAQGDLPPSLPFTVQGTASIAIPGSGVTVPFAFAGEFPVVVPPVVVPCDFGVSSNDPGAVRVEVDLCVTNPNARTVTLTEARYEIRVNDRTLVDDELGEDLEVAPRGEQRLSIVGSMAKDEAGRRLMAALLGVRTEVGIRAIGSAEFDGGIGTYPVHFDVTKAVQPHAP